MGGGEAHREENQLSDPDAYEIHESIGKGGAGTIYRATEKKMGRVVALKLLNTSHGEEGAAKRRFLTEVRAVAAMDHVGIVPIYATGELDGRPFFAMRFLEKGSLADHLGEYDSPKEAARLVAKIARAVHHAHERGVLHRDLKPSNILLDENGEPLVSDFGLAKIDDGSDDLTVTGAVMGTPQYMSPEQAGGKSSAITTASDVYSLGTILYQLLCGRTPFVGESSHEVMQNIIENDATFTRSELSTVHRDLRTICLKCLEKEPARRYGSALALAEDIECWENHEPIRARPITANERFRRWVKRHPWELVALLALMIGSVASVVLWRRAEAERVVADRHAMAAEENADYSTIANALSARERFDYGQVHRLLERIPPERRGFEWGLVNGLSQGEYQWSLEFEGALPVDVSSDSEGEQMVVLTDDRKLHFIDSRKEMITSTRELIDPVQYRSHRLWESSLAQLVPTPRATLAQMAEVYLTQLSGPRFLSTSPDGQHYAYVDGFVLIVNEVESGKTVHLGWVWEARPVWLDSDTLLFGSTADPIAGHRGETSIHQMSSGVSTHLPDNMTGPFACKPNGKLVGLVQDDHEVLLFKRQSGFHESEPLQRFIREGETVSKLQINSRETHVAIVWKTESEANLKVYEIDSGKEVLSQEFPSSPEIGFWPDAPVLAIAGSETWFSSWKVEGDKGPNEKIIDGSVIHGRQLPMNERILKASSLPEFHFGHRARVDVILSGSPGSSQMITVSADGRMAVWNDPGESLSQLRKEEVVTSLANHRPIASQNGKHVFYLRKGNQGENELCVWHREQDVESVFPHDHTQVAIFDDGRAMTLRYPYQLEGQPPGGRRDFICWQTMPGEAPLELLRVKDCHLPWGYPINQAVKTADGCIAALFTGSLHVIDTRRMKEEADPDFDRRLVYRTKFMGIRGGKVPGRTLAISPDAKFVAITGLSRSFHVFDLERSFSRTNPEKIPDEHLTEVDAASRGLSGDPIWHDSSVRDCACVFSADGSRLFVGNESGWIHVFDVRNEFKFLPEEGWQAHGDAITALAVSASGDIIATAGGDSMILWSTEKREGEPRRNRLHLNTGEYPRNWIQFADSDSVLFHSSAAGVIEAWETRK